MLVDVQFIEEMAVAASLDVVVPTPTAEETTKRSAMLFAILASLTSGRALRLVQGVKDRNGFEAWRSLCAELAPKAHSRKLGLLQSILKPPFQSSSSIDEFREKYLAWLLTIDQYEELMGKAMDSEVKIAVTVEHSPVEVKTWLQLNSNSYGSDAAKLHAMLMSYLDSKRSFQPEGSSMEADQLNAWWKKDKGKDKWDSGKCGWKDPKEKGKGKSEKGKAEQGKGGKPKGIGKGKGAQEQQPARQCHNCEEWGHMARECPSKSHMQQVDATMPTWTTPTYEASESSSAVPPSTSTAKVFQVIDESWIM